MAHITRALLFMFDMLGVQMLCKETLNHLKMVHDSALWRQFFADINVSGSNNKSKSWA